MTTDLLTAADIYLLRLWCPAARQQYDLQVDLARERTAVWQQIALQFEAALAAAH